MNARRSVDLGADAAVVTVHEAKTHLSRLLARVEAGEEIVVARGDFVAQVAIGAFKEVPVTAENAQLAGNLDGALGYPWDRLLAAQAQIEGLRLVTRDRAMPGLGTETYW